MPGEAYISFSGNLPVSPDGHFVNTLVTVVVHFVLPICQGLSECHAAAGALTGLQRMRQPVRLI